MTKKNLYPSKKLTPDSSEEERRKIVEITHRRLKERFGMIDLTGKVKTSMVISLTKRQAELLKKKKKKGTNKS